MTNVSFKRTSSYSDLSDFFSAGPLKKKETSHSIEWVPVAKKKEFIIPTKSDPKDPNFQKPIGPLPAALKSLSQTPVKK